mgnify:CR=1 FL=1
MRGEYLSSSTPTSGLPELPPRARRIRAINRNLAGKIGTTSACAENTVAYVMLVSLLWNYLRVRGEYCTPKSLIGSCGELPPRARRIRLAFQTVLAIRGTTSACAENTYLSLPTHQWPGNYLRVRGEYGRKKIMVTATMELPPRARRIQAAYRLAASIRGTTSACAENTCYSG